MCIRDRYEGCMALANKVEDSANEFVGIHGKSNCFRQFFEAAGDLVKDTPEE